MDQGHERGPVRYGLTGASQRDMESPAAVMLVAASTFRSGSDLHFRGQNQVSIWVSITLGLLVTRM